MLLVCLAWPAPRRQASGAPLCLRHQQPACSRVRPYTAPLFGSLLACCRNPQENSALTALRLRGARGLTLRSLRAAGDALRCNATLQELDLSNSTFLATPPQDEAPLSRARPLPSSLSAPHGAGTTNSSEATALAPTASAPAVAAATEPRARSSSPSLRRLSSAQLLPGASEQCMDDGADDEEGAALVHRRSHPHRHRRHGRHRQHELHPGSSSDRPDQEPAAGRPPASRRGRRTGRAAAAAAAAELVDPPTAAGPQEALTGVFDRVSNADMDGGGTSGKRCSAALVHPASAGSPAAGSESDGASRAGGLATGAGHDGLANTCTSSLGSVLARTSRGTSGALPRVHSVGGIGSTSEMLLCGRPSGGQLNTLTSLSMAPSGGGAGEGPHGGGWEAGQGAAWEAAEVLGALWSALAGGLAVNGQLRVLRLAHCGLGAVGAAALAPALMQVGWGREGKRRQCGNGAGALSDSLCAAKGEGEWPRVCCRTHRMVP